VQDETVALVSWIASALQEHGPKSGMTLKGWDIRSGTMKVFIGDPLNRTVDVVLMVRESAETAE